MTLKSTRSRVSSTPTRNSPEIIGEGEATSVASVPTESIEVKDPNILPKQSRESARAPMDREEKIDDLPVSEAIKISRGIKTTVENSTGTSRTSKIERRLELTTGKTRPLNGISSLPTSIKKNKISNQSVRNAQSKPAFALQSNSLPPLQVSAFSEDLTESDFRDDDGFNAQEQSFEAKISAVMDLSDLSSSSILDTLQSKRLESDIDRKLLQTVFSIARENKDNDDYISNLEREIESEIKNAESILNVVTSFESTVANARSSLSIGTNKQVLFENNEKELLNQLSNNYSKLRKQPYSRREAISLFESLNAYQNAEGADPQFFVWKNIDSLKSNMLNGVSNHFLVDQGKQSLSLRSFSFDYDGQNFKNFYDFDYEASNPLDKIAYYLICICSELNNSIGLGYLNQNFLNGEKWFEESSGLSADWRDTISKGFYDSLFNNIRPDKKLPLLRLGKEGCIDHYLNDFKRNVTRNSFQNYDDALSNSINSLEKFQKDVHGILSYRIKAKKLLNPTNLLKRILESFDKIIQKLRSPASINDENSKNILMCLAIIGNASSKANNKVNLKKFVFDLILKNLSEIRKQRISDDRKLSVKDDFSNSNLNQTNFVEVFNQVNIINPRLQRVSSFNYTNYYLSNIETFFSKLNDFEINDTLIFNNIIEIFLELEKECIETINREQYEVEFLTEQNLTKFSQLDASKFIFMIYQIFEKLAEMFFKSNLYNVGNETYLIAWNLASEEANDFLNKLLPAFANDRFDSAFDSLQTLTINDNLGVTNSLVTAQNFYELNETLKFEKLAPWYHLSMIKTVMSNFYLSTRIINDYSKILKNDPSIQETSLNDEQKKLKKFISTDLGKLFFSSINRVKLARARLRLNRLKSLNNVYDLANTDPEVYDAVSFYLERSNYFETKNKLMIATLNQNVLNNLLNFSFDKRPKMIIKATKINELRDDLKYASKQLIEIPLGYVLNKEFLKEAVAKTKSKGLDDITSLNALKNEIKFYDMSKFTETSYVDFTNENEAANNFNNLIESYLACIFVESMTGIDLDLSGNFKVDVNYDFSVVNRIMSMMAPVLRLQSPFETVFRNVNGNFVLRDKKDVQEDSNLGIKIASEKGTQVQLNDQFDFGKIDVLHSILDTLYVRKGNILSMIFNDTLTSQAIGILFDPESFVLDDSNLTNRSENMIRFDSLHVETEFK
jgi:hypothetical protein